MTTPLRDRNRSADAALELASLIHIPTAALLLACTASANELSFEGGITTVAQGSDDSRAEAEVTVSADLFVTLPRRNGEWLLYIEASSSPRSSGVSAFYPTVNADARSVLTQDGGGGVQVSELNYTFFMDGGRSLMLGLIDPSAWLDRGRIANDENQHFLNGSFVNNATIEFPDYTLGAVYRLAGKGSRPEMTFIATGSDGIADIPDRSYQDLLDLNSGGRSAFLGAGASWLYDRASWRLGAWLRTDDHTVADSDTDTEWNYGVYGVFGWRSHVNAMNVRVGVANPDVSIAGGFVAIAYERETPLGLFGIGIARTHISEGFRASGRGFALDTEAFFRIPIFGDSGHITPSVQYVENPGFDASDATAQTSAVVPGLRFHWSF